MASSGTHVVTWLVAVMSVLATASAAEAQDRGEFIQPRDLEVFARILRASTAQQNAMLLYLEEHDRWVETLPLYDRIGAMRGQQGEPVTDLDKHIEYIRDVRRQEEAARRRLRDADELFFGSITPILADEQVQQLEIIRSLRARTRLEDARRFFNWTRRPFAGLDAIIYDQGLDDAQVGPGLMAAYARAVNQRLAELDALVGDFSLNQRRRLRDEMGFRTTDGLTQDDWNAARADDGEKALAIVREIDALNVRTALQWAGMFDDRNAFRFMHAWGSDVYREAGTLWRAFSSADALVADAGQSDLEKSVVEALRRMLQERVLGVDVEALIRDIETTHPRTYPGPTNQPTSPELMQRLNDAALAVYRSKIAALEQVAGDDEALLARLKAMDSAASRRAYEREQSGDTARPGLARGWIDSSGLRGSVIDRPILSRLVDRLELDERGNSVAALIIDDYLAAASARSERFRKFTPESPPGGMPEADVLIAALAEARADLAAIAADLFDRISAFADDDHQFILDLARLEFDRAARVDEILNPVGLGAIDAGAFALDTTLLDADALRKSETALRHHYESLAPLMVQRLALTTRRRQLDPRAAEAQASNSVLGAAYGDLHRLIAREGVETARAIESAAGIEGFAEQYLRAALPWLHLEADLIASRIVQAARKEDLDPAVADELRALAAELQDEADRFAKALRPTAVEAVHWTRSSDGEWMPAGHYTIMEPYRRTLEERAVMFDRVCLRLETLIDAAGDFSPSD